jgi:hypothetical protein
MNMKMPESTPTLQDHYKRYLSERGLNYNHIKYEIDCTQESIEMWLKQEESSLHVRTPVCRNPLSFLTSIQVGVKVLQWLSSQAGKVDALGATQYCTEPILPVEYYIRRQSSSVPPTTVLSDKSVFYRKAADFPPPGSRKRRREPVPTDLEHLRPSLGGLCSLLDCLVPIRVDVDLLGFRYKDMFSWNLHEWKESPDSFARQIVSDLHMDKVFIPHIAQSIRRQLFSYRDYYGRLSSSLSSPRSSLHPVVIDIRIHDIVVRSLPPSLHLRLL